MLCGMCLTLTFTSQRPSTSLLRSCCITGMWYRRMARRPAIDTVPDWMFPTLAWKQPAVWPRKRYKMSSLPPKTTPLEAQRKGNTMTRIIMEETHGLEVYVSKCYMPTGRASLITKGRPVGGILPDSAGLAVTSDCGRAARSSKSLTK